MLTDTSPTNTPAPPSFRQLFRRNTLAIGILLLALGMVGLLLPTIASIATDIMIASLLLVGGVFWGAHSISSNPKNVFNWLKPLILIVSGVVMLLFPAASIEALALWLAVYLLLDMSGSMILAIRQRPAPGWGWMLFNGLVSLLLAVMILANWPTISAWFVGVYVSISLLMDGVALLALRSTVKQAESPQTNPDPQP